MRSLRSRGGGKLGQVRREVLRMSGTNSKSRVNTARRRSSRNEAQLAFAVTTLQVMSKVQALANIHEIFTEYTATNDQSRSSAAIHTRLAPDITRSLSPKPYVMR